MRDLSLGIRKSEIEAVIHLHPGITTPELAEVLSVSITAARWAVLECDFLEFYEGNHIRFKGENQGGGEQ